MQGTHGLHHLNRRRRIYEKLEPYPNPDKFKRFMDKFIFIVGLIGPIVSLPQILKIWVERNASSISLITWSFYLFIAISWLTYGIVHRDRAIIFSNSLWFLTHISIIIGVLIYG